MKNGFIESKSFFDGYFNINQFIFPDNTYRNWNAYNTKTKGVIGMDLVKLCDPQASGGLLIAISPENQTWFLDTMTLHKQTVWEIGKFLPKSEFVVEVI